MITQLQGHNSMSIIHCTSLGLLNTCSLSFCPLPLLSTSSKLDATMVEELDSTLNEGKEIAALYQEISKTLSTSHLQFESVSGQWLTTV